MKHIFVLLFPAMLFTGYADAQIVPTKDTTFPKIEFGLKLGTNITSVTGVNWDNGYKPGITGGIVVGMHKKRFGVRAEVLAGTTRYTSVKDTTNYIIDAAGTRGDFRAITLDIPVLLEYDITPRFTILAGLRYSSFLSVKNLNSFQGDATLFFKPGFSGVIGIEAKLYKNIFAGAQFIYGFTNIDNDVVSADTWQNRTIQLYAGYKIR